MFFLLSRLIFMLAFPRNRRAVCTASTVPLTDNCSFVASSSMWERGPTASSRSACCLARVLSLDLVFADRRDLITLSRVGQAVLGAPNLSLLVLLFALGTLCVKQPFKNSSDLFAILKSLTPLVSAGSSSSSGLSRLAAKSIDVFRSRSTQLLASISVGVK